MSKRDGDEWLEGVLPMITLTVESIYGGLPDGHAAALASLSSKGRAGVDAMVKQAVDSLNGAAQELVRGNVQPLLIVAAQATMGMVLGDIVTAAAKEGAH